MKTLASMLFALAQNCRAAIQDERKKKRMIAVYVISKHLGYQGIPSNLSYAYASEFLCQW